jgi:uncharacterized protein YjbI with pentapeptide repeats
MRPNHHISQATTDDPLVVVIVVLPPRFTAAHHFDKAADELKAQNDVRTTLLQALAGVVLVLGAYFTYRQVMLSRAQLQIAQQEQITERFTRAIDQLGHTGPDVRLGGIYALERIARDSPADRATIGEVLTAFVRTHASWPAQPADQQDVTAPIDEVPELQVRAPDVQACLTVLGRGGFAPPAEGQDRLDLHAVDLRRANLWEAHLEAAYLRHAHLEAAFLGGVHLDGADLRGAHLDKAYLNAARLKGAVADERTTWPEGYDWRSVGVIVRGEDAATDG